MIIKMLSSLRAAETFALLSLYALIVPGCATPQLRTSPPHHRPVVQRSTLPTEQELASGNRATPPVPELKLASHRSESDESGQIEQAVLRAVEQVERLPDPGLLPESGADAASVYPIDLSNALALGGATHLQIRMARERVWQAQADLLQARALWLPSLRAGLTWNKHDGRIQRTEGQVSEVSRNSFYTGGGLGLGTVPLNGAAGGPSRLLANLSLADAFFGPKIAQNQVAASVADSNAVFNDALLQISDAYYALLRAHGRQANALSGVKAFEDTVRLTSAFEEAGSTSRLEVNRALTQAAMQDRALSDAERETQITSAQLVRLLRLEPQLTVVPVEERVLPLEVVDRSLTLSDLLAIGVSSRPEVRENQAQVWEKAWQQNQEHWRPWLPQVQVGNTYGQFGGGRGSDYTNAADRNDIDVLAFWELQNLGYGNRALRLRSASERREACLRAQWVRDRIEAEIVAAFNNVESYRTQIEMTLDAAQAARKTYELNRQKIREGEGLPLELLQAIVSLVKSLDAYVDAVCDYNQSQFHLLRAIGQPPSAATPRQDEVAVQPSAQVSTVHGVEEASVGG